MIVSSLIPGVVRLAILIGLLCLFDYLGTRVAELHIRERLTLPAFLTDSFFWALSLSIIGKNSDR